MYKVIHMEKQTERDLMVLTRPFAETTGTTLN